LTLLSLFLVEKDLRTTDSFDAGKIEKRRNKSLSVPMHHDQMNEGPDREKKGKKSNGSSHIKS